MTAIDQINHATTYQKIAQIVNEEVGQAVIDDLYARGYQTYAQLATCRTLSYYERDVVRTAQARVAFLTMERHDLPPSFRSRLQENVASALEKGDHPFLDKLDKEHQQIVREGWDTPEIDATDLMPPPPDRDTFGAGWEAGFKRGQEHARHHWGEAFDAGWNAGRKRGEAGFKAVPGTVFDLLETAIPGAVFDLQDILGAVDTDLPPGHVRWLVDGFWVTYKILSPDTFQIVDVVEAVQCAGRPVKEEEHSNSKGQRK